MRKTVTGLIMDYFRRHDKQDLFVAPVIDRVTKEYAKMYGSKPYDCIKALQSLVDENKLTQVSEGVYRYDPDVNVPSQE